MEDTRKYTKKFCEEHGRFSVCNGFIYCPYCGKQLIIETETRAVKHRKPKVEVINVSKESEIAKELNEIIKMLERGEFSICK